MYPRKHIARARELNTRTRKSKQMKNFTEASTATATPADGNAERSYRQALKLERERERKRRRYRKGQFASSMLHIEHDFDFQRIENSDEDPRNAWISDRGAGEERVVADCDGDGSPAYYRTCVKRALNRLRNRSELRRTLRLVLKHWPRREDAIWEILASRRCPTWDAARKQYFAHLEKLLKIFCAQ